MTSTLIIMQRNLSLLFLQSFNYSTKPTVMFLSSDSSTRTSTTTSTSAAKVAMMGKPHTAPSAWRGMYRNFPASASDCTPHHFWPEQRQEISRTTIDNRGEPSRPSIGRGGPSSSNFLDHVIKALERPSTHNAMTWATATTGRISNTISDSWERLGSDKSITVPRQPERNLNAGILFSLDAAPPEQREPTLDPSTLNSVESFLNCKRKRCF